MDNITFEMLKQAETAEERNFLMKKLPVFPAEINDEIKDKVFRKNFFKGFNIPEKKQDIYIDWIYKEGNCCQKSRELNLTRARIADINRKIELMMGKERIFFREDCLLDVLSDFCIDKKIFLRIFPWISEKGFAYINLRAKRLSEKRRKRLSTKNYKEYEGIFRPEIEDFFRNMSVPALDKKLDKNSSYVADGIYIRNDKENLKVIQAVLLDKKGWIASEDRSFRYYPEQDMSFLNDIDLAPYEGCRISLKKIYSKYSDMLKAHDIRDSYELFYLMKHTMKDKLTFVRVPVIGVGKNITLEDHILKLIEKHNIADMKEARRISLNEYGVFFRD